LPADFSQLISRGVDVYVGSASQEVRYGVGRICKIGDNKSSFCRICGYVVRLQVDEDGSVRTHRGGGMDMHRLRWTCQVRKPCSGTVTDFEMQNGGIGIKHNST
jgi:hypothetical protein